MLRPKFWYCPLCGYMFIGGDVAAGPEECPMCGEDAQPCWECIRLGIFNDSWCARCKNTGLCDPLGGQEGLPPR